jgi:microcin C transport system ATP-binding protein
LLDVSGLTVQYADGRSLSPAVRDITFSLQAESALAIVGESGSGKTTLCRALTRLFSPHIGVNISGQVRFGSVNLLACDDGLLADVRRRSIRYVFQEPYSALNPVATIEKQLLLAGGSEGTTRENILQLLSDLGLPQSEQILHRYPHELSVGMAQRVMIAMALLPQPSLLIADEPTSAVDASLRNQLLRLLRSIQTKRRMAMILVTHDLAVARYFADEVLVLRNGALVEKARAEDFFKNPENEYSRLLIETMHHYTSHVRY